MSTGAAKNRECACGTGPGLIVHAPGCFGHPCQCGAMPLPEMPSGPAQGATPPKPTDDSPYRDVGRARDLATRAEKAFEAGESARGDFYLRLATEARLLAELQGRWEY